MSNSKIIWPIIYIASAIITYQVLNTNNSQQAHKFDGLIFFLILISGLNTIFLIAFLSIEPGFDEQKDIRDSSNILKTLVKEIESIKSVNQLLNLDYACFRSLITKKWHSEYSHYHDKCVLGYQCHSTIFNKTIGQNNSRFYFLFTFINFWLLVLAFWHLFTHSYYWTEAQTTNFFF